MPGTIDLQQSKPLARHGGLPAPVIEIGELEPGHSRRDAAIERLRHACRAPGYLYLSGVFQRSPCYAAVRRHMQHFFGLDDSAPLKQAINVTGQANTNGWMPTFGEPAYQPGTLAHLESFDCGRPQRPGDPGERFNRWPAIDGFRDDVRALWHELGSAGRTVMRALADALAMPPDFLVGRCSAETLSTLRLLHYPPVPDAGRSASDVGIAAHTDFECMTLIAQSAPGLELLDSNGAWRDAPAGDDRVVVLLGDMLERWTNGRVRATGHRVRPRPFRRYSIVRFFAVDEDVEVAPLPAFVSADRPAHYAPIRQGEHTRRELHRAEANRDACAETTGTAPVS